MIHGIQKDNFGWLSKRRDVLIAAIDDQISKKKKLRPDASGTNDTMYKLAAELQLIRMLLGDQS